MSVELIVIGDVEQMASARNLPLGDDRRGRWTDAGLIDPSQPIPFSTQHGYTAGQVERILFVAEIAAGLESKRPTAAEIAFQLAFLGHRAPANLVRDFLEDAVLSFQRRSLRFITNRGLRFTEDAGVLERVAGLFVSHIVKRLDKKYADSFLFQLFLQTMIGATLQAIFRGSESSYAFQIFEFGLKQIFKNAAPDAAKTVWDNLRGVFDLLRLDEGNAILGALQSEIDPADILRSANDARLVLVLGGSLIPFFGGASVSNTGGMCTEEDCQFFNRYFPAIAAAALLTLHGDSAAEERLADLRSGNVEELAGDFSTMKAIGMEVAGTPLFQRMQ